MNGGQWVFVIELFEGAALTTGRSMIERLTVLASVPVVIVDYATSPTTGKGDRVVVKAELQSRSSRIKGGFLEHLDDAQSIGIYELVVG
jgi:hypothetical protein